MELLGIRLDPLGKCIQALGMNDLRCATPSLQRGREHGNINTRKCEVGNGSQQRPVQAVQLRTAQLLRLFAGLLGVRDSAQGFCVLVLI
eukprot:10214682-Alexandrium_andersonii.AAC.1